MQGTRGGAGEEKGGGSDAEEEEISGEWRLEDGDAGEGEEKSMR